MIDTEVKSNFSSHYLTGDWIWEWLEDGRIYLAFRSVWHWGEKKQDSKSFLWCQSSFSHLGKSGLRMFTSLDTWIVVKSSTRVNLSGNLLKFQVCDFIYEACLNKIKSNGSFWSNQCKKSKTERETDREKESNNSHKSDKFWQAQIKFPAFFSLPLEGWLVSNLWAAIRDVLKAPKPITFLQPRSAHGHVEAILCWRHSSDFSICSFMFILFRRRIQMHWWWYAEFMVQLMRAWG